MPLSSSCLAQGGCHPATDEQQVVMLSQPHISGELFAPAVEFDLKERGCQKPGIFVDHKLLMVGGLCFPSPRVSWLLAVLTAGN